MAAGDGGLALVVRSVVVYVSWIALRLAGRRELGQMTTFDLVLLLVLANAVQNSINAGDNSLGGGLISAADAAGAQLRRRRGDLSLALVRAAGAGRPLPLVRNGKLVWRNMKRERVTLEELRSALAQAGVDGVSQCKHAVLESDGTLTAVRDDVTQHELSELIERWLNRRSITGQVRVGEHQRRARRCVKSKAPSMLPATCRRARWDRAPRCGRRRAIPRRGA